MHIGNDILENELVSQYPDVLEALLKDHTTKNNIFWATNNYEDLGEQYSFKAIITPELITGTNGHVIMPRVHKNKGLQQSRSRDMAEVFTPAWVCNAQNNLIDNAWFGKEDVFNREVNLKDGSKGWEVNPNKVCFPKDKTWQSYVKERRLEVACGEAPYITSRYDSTSGEFIPVQSRIGILDRKLRIINENTNTTEEWLKAAQIAYKSTYAFEWQGDNLLLARESMLVVFIENYVLKFGKEPLLKSIQCIAYIISWNVWQMDGLKGVIPNSCGHKAETSTNLFGETTTTYSFCEGCEKGSIHKHNGVYALIKNWFDKDFKTGQTGKNIRFVDLLNNRKK